MVKGFVILFWQGNVEMDMGKYIYFLISMIVKYYIIFIDGS